MNDIPSPFDQYLSHVRPEWIDHNGHMNMGYYLVVFDFATDRWLDFLGFTRSHRARARITTFALEGHITYHREVRGGDRLRFTTRLIDHDAKRIHYFHEMHHADQGYLAATNELLSLHVSLETRRATPIAPEIQQKLARVQARHDALPPAPQIGRVIGLGAGRPVGNRP